MVLVASGAIGIGAGKLAEQADALDDPLAPARRRPEGREQLGACRGRPRAG